MQTYTDGQAWARAECGHKSKAGLIATRDAKAHALPLFDGTKFPKQGKSRLLPVLQGQVDELTKMIAER